MIIFKTIRYKNLLSTGNNFTEIKLDDHQSTLVIGKNGSGKSTLIEALSFGLYGKPYRKINKHQLLNSITKKDLAVEIDFSVNKDKYKIVRGIKPNIFELYKNDVILNQTAASKDYQEMLEKQILKINHKSFCQVVILGTANFVPFMQLTTQARREIIEDILDLQIFSTMNTLLKDRVSSNNAELAEVVSDKKVVQSQIEMMKSHYETIQKGNEKFIEERQSKIESTRLLIKSAEEDVKTIIEEGRALKKKLDGKDVHKSKLSKLDEYKYKFNAKIQTAKTTSKFFKDNSTCPTCTQDIEESFRRSMIASNAKTIDGVNVAFVKLEEERLKLNNKLEEFNSVANTLNDLNLKLSLINTKTIGWNENILNWTKDIDDTKNSNQFIGKEKVEEANDNLFKLEATHNDLVGLKDILITASSILKDGGIKAKILKQYVPIINNLINKYLAAMDFFVNFELDEEFVETIKSRGRDEFSYASFSEGEKLRIDLSVLFTWRAIAKMRNSVNTNLLIMDEVFDSSLDVNGTDEFMKILKNMTADNNTFIISHRSDQMIDKFDQVIAFEKIKNFSRIKDTQ